MVVEARLVKIPQKQIESGCRLPVAAVSGPLDSGAEQRLNIVERGGTQRCEQLAGFEQRVFRKARQRPPEDVRRCVELPYLNS